MNILRLTLRKKWFDMILSGEKLEEYRQIKPYWITRIYNINPTTVYEFEDMEELQHQIREGYKVKCPFKKFDAIQFTNGYSKTSPTFTIECLGISIKQGNHEWGAPLEEVFALKLGKIISN